MTDAEIDKFLAHLDAVTSKLEELTGWTHDGHGVGAEVFEITFKCGEESYFTFVFETANRNARPHVERFGRDGTEIPTDGILPNLQEILDAIVAFRQTGG